jgi:5-methyltetrahydrofolate--homocysteine methyltransferase
LAQALRQHDFSVVANEAIKQVEAGASLVDVNMGIRVPNASEGDLLQSAVLAVQRVTGCPLSIDTVHYQAMRQALTVCRGKPLLNSANGDEDNLEQVTDLAAKYGAALVGLTLDSRGLPTTARERVQIARRIVERALAKGVAREDIYIDGLTLTAGASQAQLLETLHTIQLVKSELGVRTVLGVSNISHGLPERAMLNNAFLAMALGSGLDLPIVNPAQTGLWSVISAADVITNRDQHAAAYLSRASLKTTDQTSVKQQNAPAGLPSEQQLLADILSGERTRLETLTNTLLGQGESAMDLINHIVIPAMEEAGRRYDQHRFFLPQLLLAAEAAQVTFSLLHPLLCQTTEAARGTIVLATVKGDIHDIGKNIVGLLLSNHGFRVIDLGKDVSSELIINTACQEQADLIALSALMTTTMPEMGVVAQKLKQRQLQIPLLVGGAAVSADFAASIGAHYAADATLAVEQAKSLVRRTTDGSGSLSCTS